MNVESGTQSAVDQRTAELATVNEQSQREVAERKRASGATGTLGQFSDSIVENVNVWLNVYDTQLNIVVWNKVAEEISGYSREEVVGHSKIWEWSYPDEEYRKAITAKSATLVEKDETLEYFETRIRCKNGETKTMLWNTRSLVDESGTVYGAITFGYDITDRKRAEEALRKAHSEISALYNVASVASASLDLDTILERSLDRVLATMKSDKGVIHLLDEEEKTLRLAAQQGIPPDVMAQIDPVASGNGLVGWVFDHGKPLIIPNLANDPLRKDASEIASLQRAVEVAEAALEEVVSSLSPGVAEREICSQLTSAMLLGGGETVPFEPLVLSGPRSALPHGRTGERRVETGEILLIDFGTTVNGYHSDITRTFVVGQEPNDRLREVYAAVQAANEAGRAAVRPGTACQDVDRVARQVLVEAGFGEHFIHRTGHGLGLDVHEEPGIVGGNDMPLEEGMVFTVEPGVYLEGWGGIRIEDNVVVTADGCESLTTFSRALRVVAS
jgi:PAS domain S-box-containing protein